MITCDVCSLACEPGLEQYVARHMACSRALVRSAPFDLVAAIHADVSQLYVHGYVVRPGALVYMVNPVDSARAQVAEGGPDTSTTGQWHLFTSAGPVELQDDLDQPRTRVTRMWRCACSALYIDNGSRQDGCRACVHRRLALADTITAEEGRKLFDEPLTQRGRALSELRKSESPRMRQWVMPLSPDAFKALLPSQTQALAERCKAAVAGLYDHSEPSRTRTPPQNFIPSTDPLDVQYDGVPLRRLLEMDANRRTEHIVGVILSPAQRAAISAHWSAELRAKVAAAKATERNRVTITHEED